MTASVGRSILIIALCAACTFAERLLPFAVFGRRGTPKLVAYLGRMLPMAVITTLVVYCLRGLRFTSLSGFLPQLLAAGVTAALHFWKGNTLVSVVGGTACYMLLVQLVFRG